MATEQQITDLLVAAINLRSELYLMMAELPEDEEIATFPAFCKTLAQIPETHAIIDRMQQELRNSPLAATADPIPAQAHGSHGADCPSSAQTKPSTTDQV